MKKKTIINTIKGQKYVYILGIKILSTSVREVLTGIKKKIPDSDKFLILTPNPELVLASTKNPKLKEIINSASFAVPDGVGLDYASQFLYKKRLPIIPGRKLFEDLIDLASQKRWRVFLLGGEAGEAELTAAVLSARYKNLEVQSDEGPRLDKFGMPVSLADKKAEREAILKINKFKPHLLFLAFGGNPKQELWAAKNTNRLKANGIMTVGGTFRYLSGLSPLPPKFFEGWGEWFWRLITEPKRIKRVFNATVLFPIAVVLGYFKNK